MMAVGGVGVISVASNVVPRAVADMVHHALAGRWTEARELHLKYYPLFADLFIDTNPIPVKTALALMGRIEDAYRLPLCEMSEGLKKRLEATLRGLSLI
jgi:4-hydroxy-tetrahydrodipicolinate synthase